MADIIYTYKNQVYANITNKCDCACTFCIRSQTDAIGEATSLWHKVDPTYEQIIAAIDAFDFNGYDEFVFCGYGEPTCALDILEKTAKYVKEKYKYFETILSYRSIVVIKLNTPNHKTVN